MANPKPAGEKKDIVLRVCVNQAQKDQLAAAAERAGLDLTVWLRMVGLAAAEAATPQPARRTSKVGDEAAAPSKRSGKNG